MPRYAMIDAEGNVANISEWDGETLWSPPEGIVAIINCENEPNAERGGTYANGVFTRIPELFVEEPAVEEAAAQE